MELNLGSVRGADGKNCHIRYSAFEQGRAPSGEPAMTTEWASGLNYIGFALNSSTSAPEGPQEYRWSRFAFSKLELLNLVYPIGAVYQSTANVSPGALLGGDWEAFGAGRVLVGAGEYAGTLEEGGGRVGGERRHKLDIDELARHFHVYHIRSSNMSPGGNYTCGLNLAFDTLYPIETTSVGGDKAHENMPPYTVIYRWRRAA